MGRGWVTPSSIGLIPMVFIVLFGLINNISAEIRVRQTNSPAVSLIFFFKKSFSDRYFFDRINTFYYYFDIVTLLPENSYL